MIRILIITIQILTSSYYHFGLFHFLGGIRFVHALSISSQSRLATTTSSTKQQLVNKEANHEDDNLLIRSSCNSSSSISRRGILISTISGVASSSLFFPNMIAHGQQDEVIDKGQNTKNGGKISTNDVKNTVDKYAYELRDRNKNKDAIIRDDIWYFTGQNPPRKLDLSNLPPGPKYNAWGSCTTDSSTGNSCTYVSLKQRIPAYSQYAFSISLGAKDFTDLGTKLNSLSYPQPDTISAAVAHSSLLKYVEAGQDAKYLPPAPDALLKMVLMATAMLTSPNYTGPPFELLIARYYINETAFSMREIANALKVNDVERAQAAWRFGADSWNSYFTILNNAIVPKVGEKFEMIII